MNAARIVALAGGAANAVLGVWAFVAPRSFYDFATYPPFNEHFIHDVGAFLVGLAAVLLIAALAPSRTGLFVALAGVAAGTWVHAVSHLVDREIGGGSWRDPILTVAFAAVLTAAAWSTRRPTS